MTPCLVFAPSQTKAGLMLAVCAQVEPLPLPPPVLQPLLPSAQADPPLRLPQLVPLLLLRLLVSLSSNRLLLAKPMHSLLRADPGLVRHQNGLAGHFVEALAEHQLWPTLPPARCRVRSCWP